MLPEDEAHFKGGSRMDAVRVERLDHLGLIASVIKDVRTRETNRRASEA